MTSGVLARLARLEVDAGALVCRMVLLEDLVSAQPASGIVDANSSDVIGRLDPRHDRLPCPRLG